MKEYLSELTTKILHPLLMPFYAAILPFLYADIYFVTFKQSLYFFLLVATFIVILPALTGLFLRLTNGKWITLEKKALELIPEIISALLSIYLVLFLSKLGIPLWFNCLILASATTLFATGIINYFWNISKTLAGLGGILGSMMSVCYFMKGLNPSTLFIVLFIVSGFVGSCQLATNKHDKTQVYIGFAGGWLLSFASVLLSILVFYLVE